MSSDIEKEPLSRQQKKSKETKARIFHAAKTILQKQGYDQLSIKNICDEAGVSNGSFYHHFKTKDDLLSYYIEEQPSINPDLLDLPENAEEFPFEEYDYIVDAIDTVEGKLSLIENAKKYNIPIICAMGAGNKMDPTKFEVTDISKTTVCPLARVIRNELKKRHIKKVKVVFSTEPPIKPQNTEEESYKKTIPGSNAFVPPVVGLIIAGEVIKDLIGYDKKNTGI